MARLGLVLWAMAWATVPASLAAKTCPNGNGAVFSVKTTRYDVSATDVAQAKAYISGEGKSGFERIGEFTAFTEYQAAQRYVLDMRSAKKGTKNGEPVWDVGFLEYCPSVDITIILPHFNDPKMAKCFAPWVEAIKNHEDEHVALIKQTVENFVAQKSEGTITVPEAVWNAVSDPQKRADIVRFNANADLDQMDAELKLANASLDRTSGHGAEAAVFEPRNDCGAGAVSVDFIKGRGAKSLVRATKLPGGERVRSIGAEAQVPSERRIISACGWNSAGEATVRVEDPSITLLDFKMKVESARVFRAKPDAGQLKPPDRPATKLEIKGQADGSYYYVTRHWPAQLVVEYAATDDVGALSFGTTSLPVVLDWYTQATSRDSFSCEKEPF